LDVNFVKYRLGRLKICAKIIFSVPVSSWAGIERL